MPDAEATARITADLHRLNEELRESGSWVFTGGLHAPATATVVRADGMITDGPYAEGKEHIGGIWVITRAGPGRGARRGGARRRPRRRCRSRSRPFQDVAPL